MPMITRVDRFWWVLSCVFFTFSTVLLFIPALSDLYLSIGRYIIYLAFFISSIAIALTWHHSYKLKGWRNYAMAAIKTLVLAGISFMALVMFITTRSGI
ncbi:MAG: hypothetical protein ACI9OH_000894 [Oleispira sp.]|jgi:hypothetical protein